MAEHSNADLFRRGYKAFGEGDMDTLRGIIAEDAVWHSPGNNQLAGDHKGVDSILGLFGKEFEITNGTVNVELHDVLANDEHMVGLHTARSTRNGKDYSSTEALVAHVSNGKVTEFWLLPMDAKLFDEAWA
jgi:ketosteroid isomerase-like protein